MLGTISKNKTHQAITTKATPVVNHQICSNNQLPAMEIVPVSRIVHGWHHQGFNDQKG
jgi:hypothetical protein